MIIEGVKLFCFGASYAVALGSELAASLVPTKIRRGLSLGFTAAGVAAHTIYIGYHSIGAESAPLKGSFDSLLVLSWVLAVLYLSVHWYYPKATVGVFVLPVVLGLVGLAAILGPDSRQELEGWAGIWVPLHVLILLGGAIAVFIGFLAGLMYLVQAYRLKAKRLSSEAWGLPSLEFLERLNHGGITAAFSLLTVGLGIGLWLAMQQGRGTVGIRLLDPKVISAGGMWLLFGFLLQVRSRPQFRGRWVALLTIVGFGLLVFTIVGVDLLMDTWHPATPGGIS